MEITKNLFFLLCITSISASSAMDEFLKMEEHVKQEKIKYYAHYFGGTITDVNFLFDKKMQNLIIISKYYANKEYADEVEAAFKSSFENADEITFADGKKTQIFDTREMEALMEKQAEKIAQIKIKRVTDHVEEVARTQIEEAENRIRNEIKEENKSKILWQHAGFFTMGATITALIFIANNLANQRTR